MDYKEEHCWHDFNTAEMRRDRASLRDIVLLVYGWIGALCLVFLFALAATWPTKANAQEIPVHVYEDQLRTIRLMNKPCVDPVSISMIRPDALHRFKAIDSTWTERDGSRKNYAGCWAELTKEEFGGEEEAFLFVFSDGESGAVPKSEFTKKRGQSGA